MQTLLRLNRQFPAVPWRYLRPSQVYNSILSSNNHCLRIISAQVRKIIVQTMPPMLVLSTRRESYVNYHKTAWISIQMDSNIDAWGVGYFNRVVGFLAIIRLSLRCLRFHDQIGSNLSLNVEILELYMLLNAQTPRGWLTYEQSRDDLACCL